MAHDGMITCLDAYDNILISGGVDKKVGVWDLRMMDTTTGYYQPSRKLSLDDSALLKVAIGPSSNFAAVSTLKGLYLLDLTSGSCKPAAPFKDKRPIKRYHDLKWNANKSVLFAAGEDFRVDVFTTIRQ